MTIPKNVIIFAASDLYLFGLAVAAIYFVVQPRDRQKHMAFYGMITGVLTFVLSRLISPFYDDPRPFVTGHFVPLIKHVADNGFPSDHVLLMSAVTAALVPYSKKVACLVGVLTVVIGVARVCAGVHHAVDIIGAMAIAAGSAILVAKVIMPRIVKSTWYKDLLSVK